MIAKICKQCHQPFETEFTIRLYCSESCKIQHDKQRIMKPILHKICVQCGNPFETTDLRRKSCSQTCMDNRRKQQNIKRATDTFNALNREQRQVRYNKNSRSLPARRKKKYDALKQKHDCLRCGKDIHHLHFRRKYCPECSKIMINERRKI